MSLACCWGWPGVLHHFLLYLEGFSFWDMVSSFFFLVSNLRYCCDFCQNMWLSRKLLLLKYSQQVSQSHCKWIFSKSMKQKSRQKDLLPRIIDNAEITFYKKGTRVLRMPPQHPCPLWSLIAGVWGRTGPRVCRIPLRVLPLASLLIVGAAHLPTFLVFEAWGEAAGSRGDTWAEAGSPA